MEEIFELSTETEWCEAFPVLNTLRKDLTELEFLLRRTRLIYDGYHLFGLRSEGGIVAVASVAFYPHVTKEKNCWVHDLATLESERSKGFGARLMRGLEAWAKAQGCAPLCVDTRLDRSEAQRFYKEKLGYP